MRWSWRLVCMLRSVHRHCLIRPLLFPLIPRFQSAVRIGKVDPQSCVLSQFLVQRHLLPWSQVKVWRNASSRGLKACSQSHRVSSALAPSIFTSMTNKALRHIGACRAGFPLPRCPWLDRFEIPDTCNHGTLTFVSQDNSTQKRVRCSLYEVG